MRSRRKLVILVIIAAVILLVAYGFIPRPVKVEVEKATRGPMIVAVEEEGKTRVKDRYVISAPVAGYLRRISHEVGDPVEKGQEVAVLEPLRPSVLNPRSRAEAKAQVEAARAALKAAGEKAQAAAADADFAGAELKRIRGLSESGFASNEALERAESEERRAQATLQSSEFEVDVARHELEAARTALRYSAASGAGASPETVSVKTPVPGSVLKVFRKSEGVLASAEALVEVGDPRALEVEVDVLSEDSVRIAPGSRVLFDRWGGDTPLEGRVRVIEPIGFTKVSALGIEEQRVLVISDIVSPPAEWERLGDGYRVEARFVLWEGDDVLQVPQSAVFRHGEGWAVFGLRKGKAVLIPVRTGHRSGLSVEILEGLREGQEVIAHPDNELEDGTRVEKR